MNFFLRKGVAITISALIVFLSTYFSIKSDLCEMIADTDCSTVYEFCAANKVNTVSPAKVLKLTDAALPLR